jgi:hypothetical protein
MSSWRAFSTSIYGTQPQENWLDEVWNWYVELKNFSFVFVSENSSPWLSYNVHLWSMPVEFKHRHAPCHHLLPHVHQINHPQDQPQRCC